MFSFWELIFKHFFLASTMWLYCPYSYYLLDFGSHSITSDSIITTHIFPHGKENSFFPWINFENTFGVYIQAGILEPEEVAQSYFKDIIALFFGSLSLAYAIECVNLHRRIALFVLSLVGTSKKWYFFHSSNIQKNFEILPRRKNLKTRKFNWIKHFVVFFLTRTMAGLMAVTAFLSMWSNNSAATSIMLPVVLAITQELERHEKDYHDKRRAIKEASAAVNGKRTGIKS